MEPRAPVIAAAGRTGDRRRCDSTRLDGKPTDARHARRCSDRIRAERLPVFGPFGAESDDEGSGHPASQQSITVAFGLGSPRGQRVNSVDYGIALTAATLVAAPPTQARIAVAADTINELCTGGDGADGVPPPPDRLVGGEQDPAETRHTNSGFVNQDTALRGCVQAGFSNSLQWLKKSNPSLSGVKDEDIALDALAAAVGSTEASGAPDGFIAKKRDYLAARNVPIDTIEVGVADVGARIDQKCDVEMWTEGAVKHFVAVVGLSKGKDGKYSIDVAHDTKQGEKGGTLTETVTYDPAANQISGGAWLDKGKVLSFVVECPR